MDIIQGIGTGLVTVGMLLLMWSVPDWNLKRAKKKLDVGTVIGLVGCVLLIVSVL